MAKIIRQRDVEKNTDFYLDEIRKGKIFIYPTDTIYGIGCDATNGQAIERIRKLKKRDEKPFSIIVPDLAWIHVNCNLSGRERPWADKLPGPYTLILKLKNQDCVAKESLIGNLPGIGVRIPDNWFARFLSKGNVVFVTTSVNISGDNPIKEVREIPEKILEGTDYIIDSGILDGKPSKIINLLGKVEIVER